MADPFVISIGDPCDVPFSLTASNLVNQEYTITAAVKNYQVPVFTSDPVWCEITYSYTITNLAGDAAVSFNNDPIVREFNFYYSVDLNLCGLTSIDYLVTVVG